MKPFAASFALFVTVIATACGTDSTGADNNSVSVNGSYKGTLTQVKGTTSSTATMTFALTQSGNTVTGTLKFEGETQTVPATGTLTGSALTLKTTSTQTTFDDCHLYPWTWNFNVTSTDLVVTSVTGQDCVGDGKGGHSALNPLGTISGSLKKQ